MIHTFSTWALSLIMDILSHSIVNLDLVLLHYFLLRSWCSIQFHTVMDIKSNFFLLILLNFIWSKKSFHGNDRFLFNISCQCLSHICKTKQLLEERLQNRIFNEETSPIRVGLCCCYAGHKFQKLQTDSMNPGIL